MTMKIPKVKYPKHIQGLVQELLECNLGDADLWFILADALAEIGMPDSANTAKARGNGLMGIGPYNYDKNRKKWKRNSILIDSISEGCVYFGEYPQTHGKLERKNK